MRMLLPILIFMLFLSCKPRKGVQVSGTVDTVISKEELSEVIDTLSSDYFMGRETGTKEIDKAATYIENYLKALKIKPYFRHYRDSFSVYGATAFNIIGLIPGTDDVLKEDYLILSAHYDHVGVRNGKSDSICNGANDNATGVSTVLNIAKIISKNKLNKRSIIIALFSAEELGLLGAYHFCRKVEADSAKMYMNVNIDMIGSVLTKQPEKVYVSGYNKSNIAAVFNQYIGGEAIVNWKSEELYGLFYASDNYPFYEILKLPAHTFCTFDFSNYEHYHKVSDEIRNINMDNTLAIANNIRRGFVLLANDSKREIKLNK